MQAHKQANKLAWLNRRLSFFVVRTMVISTLVIVVCMTLLPSVRVNAQASRRSAMYAVVYDVTHNRYYTYNAPNQFIAASSMKVPIMLTFLDMIERQGRGPTSHEMALLTTMIENSNNDSASALYYGEIGGAGGVASYLQSVSVRLPYAVNHLRVLSLPDCRLGY